MFVGCNSKNTKMKICGYSLEFVLKIQWSREIVFPCSIKIKPENGPRLV